MYPDSSRYIWCNRCGKYRNSRFLKAEIDIGDIVLSSDAVQHDMDATGFGYEPGQIPRVETLAFKADEGLIHLAEECCSKVNPDIHTFVGRVVTGDQFISDKGKRSG